MYNDHKNIEPVKFSGLRKKHLNLTKADKKSGVNLFSIVNSNQQRSNVYENYLERYGFNIIQRILYLINK